ncbi:gluconate 2-dehydrogenase subunit 3 family protein [Paraglaciecola aquimarina]|uniref:Gluconate 2-dehydrogenase subunit 3 family protein n=1 Tax=Paraglaciecola algarum TaxID=3050085 RepID=A0ABS9D212_9ALTE|nr:gluconate 2-dehydrogenase subunit 3 family protein [Paraglaciecola sp. G1-23]MCF2946947.1 gluconate 2-dehydrogenase subunit 3 family protein [Paraglaciecola sp. G1-23]
MHRRDILKYVAAVTGTAICAPLTTALLSGCSKQAEILPPTVATGPNLADGQFFTSDNLQHLVQIMDVILPKTDTPSASDVKVHMIMDNMFDKVFTPQYKKNFLNSFAKLNDYLASKKFPTASANEQALLLTQLELAQEPSQGFKAYIDIKQQTIAYYLSNEQIAEHHLNYLPIPGGYTPSIKVAEVGGKAWAE